MWCVKNGLAVAPPGIGCNIGVSTSRYSLLFKNSRILFVIWVLLINVSLTSELTIKSTYLWRYLSSGSLNSSYKLPSLSSFGRGNGLRDFESNLKFLTKTVFSPTFVSNKFPSTPIISPMSSNFLYSSLYITLSWPGQISSLLK